jgi:hypothetical protein
VGSGVGEGVALEVGEAVGALVAVSVGGVEDAGVVPQAVSRLRRRGIRIRVNPVDFFIIYARIYPIPDFTRIF